MTLAIEGGLQEFYILMLPTLNSIDCKDSTVTAIYSEYFFPTVQRK